LDRREFLKTLGIVIAATQLPPIVPRDFPASTIIPEDTRPVGMMTMVAGMEVPEGYLPCDGRTLDIKKYPELYVILGENNSFFGQTPEDRKNLKFKLPDLRPRTVASWLPDNVRPADQPVIQINYVIKAKGNKAA
jgi:hypothetical protein